MNGEYREDDVVLQLQRVVAIFSSFDHFGVVPSIPWDSKREPQRAAHSHHRGWWSNDDANRSNCITNFAKFLDGNELRNGL
jgi:hypothetical protein